MDNLTTAMNIEVALPKEEDNLCQYFTKEELDKTAEELDYTREHPEEYKSYNNISELKEALLNDE